MLIGNIKKIIIDKLIMEYTINLFDNHKIKVIKIYFNYSIINKINNN